MLDFSEYIKNFEAVDNSTALIIVDVQESFSKYINDEYLDVLVKYCENFDRVYQIYDTHDQEEPTWQFPNQYSICGKKYIKKPLGEWSDKELKIEFHAIDLERNKKLIADPVKDDYLISKDNAVWLYVGNEHKWFKMETVLQDMLKDLKSFNLEPVIVGGSDGACYSDILIACKYVGLKTTSDYKYIYSSTFCPKGR